MKLFLKAFAFGLACAATAAAQSGRVKRAEPSAQPTPEAQSEAAQQDGSHAETGIALDDAEPERDEEGNRIYLARQVDLKARLLSRPEPTYPRRARRNNVQGTVRLRVVLAASGKVERVTVLKSLPEGLTEEAIRAARRIKFLPAERDGRRVSQSAIIEYNFNIH